MSSIGKPAVRSLSAPLIFLMLAPAAALAQSTGQVTPFNGVGVQGSQQLITITASDPGGWQNLVGVDVVINSTSSGTNACFFAYFPSSESIYLFNNSTGGWAPGYANVGAQSGSASNTQCTIYGNGSSVSTQAGGVLSLTVNVSFAVPAGTLLYFWEQVAENGGASSGWWQILNSTSSPASFFVTGSGNLPPSIGTVNPLTSTASVGTSTTLTFTGTDPNGSADVVEMDFVLNSTPDGSTGCFYVFFPQINAVYLVQDSSPFTWNPVGVNGYQPQGTQTSTACTLSSAGTTASGAGTTESLNLNFSLSSSLVGTNYVWQQVIDRASVTSGWLQIPGASITISGPAISFTHAHGNAGCPSGYVCALNDGNSFSVGTATCSNGANCNNAQCSSSDSAHLSVTITSQSVSSISVSGTATRSAIGTYTVTCTTPDASGDERSVEIFDAPPIITSVSQSGPLPQGGQISVQVTGQYLGLHTGHLNFCVSGSNPYSVTSDIQALSYTSWTDTSVTALVQASPTALGAYSVDVASSGANGSSFQSNPGSGQTGQSQPVGQVTVSARPIIFGPGQSTSFVLWYLGGARSIDGYSINAVLTVQPPNDGNPTPTIQWSTDSPSRLSISPAAGGLSATISATGASVFQAGYDVHVTVIYDGIPSYPFPLLLNTPTTMTTSSPGQYCNESGTCGCSAISVLRPIGYANSLTHGIADLTGNIMNAITTAETLENERSLNSTYGVYVLTPGVWSNSARGKNVQPWNANQTFSDVLATCTDSNDGLVPPLSSYSPNGTNVINTVTQKFWVGSSVGFDGACVQVAVLSSFTDHAALTQIFTPVTEAICEPGNFVN